MKIIYENGGGKIYIKEHGRSYRRNFCSCKKKAWKNSGLYKRITKSLTFFTIISAVVRHILIDLSTTGWTSSCTARSMAGRTNCFRWGCCWNSGICTEMEMLLGTTFTTTTNGLLSFEIKYSFKANFDVSGQLVSRFSALLPTLFEARRQANSFHYVNFLLD